MRLSPKQKKMLEELKSETITSIEYSLAQIKERLQELKVIDEETELYKKAKNKKYLKKQQSKIDNDDKKVIREAK